MEHQYHDNTFYLLAINAFTFQAMQTIIYFVTRIKKELFCIFASPVSTFNNLGLLIKIFW